jgi:hypothetical protein
VARAVTFGDSEPADAYDTAPPDAEQVARRLHAIRRERGLEPEDWDAQVEERRALLVAIMGRLLARGQREGWVRGG